MLFFLRVKSIILGLLCTSKDCCVTTARALLTAALATLLNKSLLVSFVFVANSDAVDAFYEVNFEHLAIVGGLGRVRFFFFLCPSVNIIFKSLGRLEMGALTTADEDSVWFDLEQESNLAVGCI